MPDDREPVVETVNAAGRSPVLLLCEHASNHIPERYHGLGLAPEHRESHAAWDPGALALAVGLSGALDAPLVAGRVSRLVYDCNRPPEAESAMPAQSEVIEVPGNRALSPEARAERVAAIYRPFCDAVGQALARHPAPRALVTVHSFTPVYHGARREVEIGILHDSDTRLADAMLAHAGALPHRRVQRNAPYGPEDGVTHSLKLHGIENGLLTVMIEVRNDLLADAEAIETMTRELLTLLRPALAACRLEDAADA